jgi:hypothetical protein
MGRYRHGRGQRPDVRAFHPLDPIRGAVFASQTAYLITIAGVLWGMLLLHEHHSLWIWAAMLAMCAGVALVTRRRPRPAGEALG